MYVPSLSKAFAAGLLSVFAGFAAQADAFREHDIYRPAVRPGHVAWVTAWNDPEGGLYVSFIEKKRGRNLLWKPYSLEAWEAFGLPYGYHTAMGNAAKDIVYEYVILKSTDQGSSWKEIGRSVSASDSTVSWTSLPGGEIGRSLANDYSATVREETMMSWFETSADGGKTWRRQGDIFEGHNGSGSPHRLRRLRDGTLAQLASVTTPWGPGTERTGRHVKRPNVKFEATPSLFFSRDGGQTWSSPLPVLPGVVEAWEPDFVELRSGDLLVMNSTVQGGAQARQYVRPTRFGWVPSPLFDVEAGRVPETVVLTDSGVLVGAVRGGGYFASKDEGATWHQIAGLPKAGYQPFITQLSGGRLFCAWHGGGGDVEFGKHDLWIGAHSFRLAGTLPEPVQLSLTRELDEARERYTHSFRATLSAAGRPLAGRTIKFTVKRRSRPEQMEMTAVTNDAGEARIDLASQFAGETDIHLHYRVQARFDPGAGDSGLGAAASVSHFHYVVGVSRSELLRESK
jgi:hypothetical protein